MRTFIIFSALPMLLTLSLLPMLLDCGPKVVVAPTEHETDAGEYPAPPDNEIAEHPEGSTLALTSPCGRACENLRRLDCSEGFPTPQGKSCYLGCLSMARDQRVPTRCWFGAMSVEAVRACGGLRCVVRAK
jgi:hypothetical protein